MYKDRFLRDLSPLDNNPRTISDESFSRLCESLDCNPDYFAARPLILSDRTGSLVIIAGNMRFRAAKEIGLAMVPTYLIQGLDEDREREIILRDNVNNGEWDLQKLRDEFGDFNFEDLGIDVDWSELEKLANSPGWTDPDTSENNVVEASSTTEVNKPFKSVKVKFKTEEDYLQFKDLLDIELSDIEKETFYPQDND